MNKNIRKDVERFVKNCIEPLIYVSGSLNDLENTKHVSNGNIFYMCNDKEILQTITKISDNTYEFEKLTDIFTVALRIYKTNVINNSFFTKFMITNSIILNSIDEKLGVKTKKHYEIERNGLFYSVIFYKTFSTNIHYDIQVFDKSGELILGIDNYDMDCNLHVTIMKPEWFTIHEQFRFEKFDLFTNFEPKLSTGIGKIFYKLLKTLVSKQNEKDSDRFLSIYKNKCFKEIIKYLYENDINLNDLDKSFIYNTVIYTIYTPEGKEAISNISKCYNPTEYAFNIIKGAQIIY